jgi:hypothetical protein
VGGFAPDAFAYYEDVDLGWRMWLAGYSVVHVPSAVVRHRGGGSADTLPTGRSAVLHERNALANVVRWYDPGRLRALLPAALAMAAVRAGADEGCAEAAIELADRTEPGRAYGLPVLPRSWPGWSALAGLELDWLRLSRSRSHAQARRRVPDVAVLPLMVDPLAPVPPTAAVCAAHELVVDRLRVGAVLGVGDAGLVPPGDHVGRRYAPGLPIGRRRVVEALRAGGIRAALDEVRVVARGGTGSGRRSSAEPGDAPT